MYMYTYSGMHNIIYTYTLLFILACTNFDLGPGLFPPCHTFIHDDENVINAYFKGS